MNSSIPTTTLPGGIPTYVGRHNKYVWPSGKGPQLLLFQDFDLLWVKSGRAALDFAAEVQLTARPGDMILVPPLVAVMIAQTSGQVVFWYCHFDFRITPAGAQDAVTVPLKLSASRNGAVRKVYETLNSIGENAHCRAWQRESSLIQLVCAVAAGRWSLPKRRGNAPEASPDDQRLISRLHDPRVVVVRNRIDADPGRPWRVEELARGVDLSRGHLHALWRAALGSSLKSYLVRSRLRKAMSLRRSPSSGPRSSIKQVAAAAGFSSQHLFCRQFRQAFGVTPTAFCNSAGL